MSTTVSMFVCRADKDYLYALADTWNVNARHVLGALIYQLQAIQSQRKLLPVMSELQARACALCQEEDCELRGRINAAVCHNRFAAEQADRTEFARRRRHLRRVNSDGYKQAWAETVRKWREDHAGDPEPTFDEMLAEYGEGQALDSALKRAGKLRRDSPDRHISSKEWARRMRLMHEVTRERHAKSLSPIKVRRAA